MGRDSATNSQTAGSSIPARQSSAAENVVVAELVAPHQANYNQPPNPAHAAYAPYGNIPRQPSYHHRTSTLQDWVEGWEKHFATEPAEELYSVPRRYDLSSMFSISVAYALLFSIMRALNSPPAAVFLTGAFFAIVGAAQAILFKGKRPREASVIAGLVGGFLCTIVFTMVSEISVEGAVGLVFLSLIASPLAGYLAGTTIGGIWLIADYLRQWSNARKESSEESTTERHVLDP